MIREQHLLGMAFTLAWIAACVSSSQSDYEAAWLLIIVPLGIAMGREIAKLVDTIKGN